MLTVEATAPEANSMVLIYSLIAAGRLLLKNWLVLLLKNVMFKFLNEEKQMLWRCAWLAIVFFNEISYCFDESFNHVHCLLLLCVQLVWLWVWCPIVGALALLVRTIVIVELILVYRNFGKGLKERGMWIILTFRNYQLHNDFWAKLKELLLVTVTH